MTRRVVDPLARFHVSCIGACLALLLLAGCGGGAGDGDGGGPTVTTLFSDDFSSGSLMSNWVLSGQGAGTGTITSDGSFGSPAPSAWFSKPFDATSLSPKLTSIATFTPGGGLTISFRAATRTAGSAGTLLVWANGGNCYGNVEIFPTKVQYSLKSGNFNIQGTQLVNPDSDFHTFTFQVTPGGVPSLHRDGQAQLSSQASAACTADSSIFKIEATINRPDAVLGVSASLDSVVVTRP